MSRSAMGEDARFELSLAATGRERANRPRALVAGAVLALVVAAVAAIWGLASMRSARAAYSRTLAEQVEVDQLNKEWEKLDQAERDSGPGGREGVGRHIDPPYSRMEQLAAQARLKDTPQPPRPNETTRGAVKVVEYTYTNVRDPSLKALLEWTRLATEQIPGMEVYGLTLKPDPNNWNMTVTFRRWERAQ